MKISQKARNAIFIGTLCSVSYLAIYLAKNIIGAVTPKMKEDGFSLEYIGSVTAVYLLSYAFGQLINGNIGNYIKGKYMISTGLMMAGIANFVFVGLSDYPNIAIIAYAFTGFSLSMIYGPMTRVVAENTELVYATRCSLGYTFSSFLGSPMAGFLATFLTWQATFNVGSILLIVMSITCFTFFTVFEKKGIVTYRERKKEVGKASVNFKELTRRHIIKFALIAMITGTVRVSFVGFLSTYFYEYLGYSEEESASIFSVATLVICFTAFIAVFIYERLSRNLHLCPLLFFSAAAILFTAVYFVKNPIINIILVIAAIMASNSSSTMLYSVYCPSMRDTGLVSGITGFLDFLSYISSALASFLIPKIVALIGWRNMLLVIVCIMATGAAICIPYFINKKKNAATE